MKKIIIAAVLSAVLLLNFSGIVQAANMKELFKSTSPMLENPVSFVTDFDGIMLMSAEDYDEDGALNAIHQGLLKYETKIDIKEFNIPVSEIKRIVNKAFYMYSEMYCVNSYTYYYSNQNIVLTFCPIYSETAEVMSKKLRLYKAYKENVLSNVTEDMTDLEKIITIHDYLVMYLEYDGDYSIYDGVNMAMSGTGVCQGYSQLFYDLCTDLGISCGFALRDAIKDENGKVIEAGHIWNIVKLNGEWYHVDLTWDDPLNDVYGRVSHEFFLVSDERIKQLDSTRKFMSSERECTSKQYDDPVWDNKWFSPIVVDNYWLYYIKDRKIMRYNFETEEILYSFSNEGILLSGLGIYNGNLYFNSPGGDINIINLETKEVSLFDAYVSEGSEILQSLAIDKGILTGGIAKLNEPTAQILAVPLGDEGKTEIIAAEQFAGKVYVMLRSSSAEPVKVYLQGTDLAVSDSVFPGFGRMSIEYDTQGNIPVNLFVWTEQLRPVSTVVTVN